VAAPDTPEGPNCPADKGDIMTSNASTSVIGGRDRALSPAAVDTPRPSYQAYRILQLGFTAAPIIAGLDKFFHGLVDWDKYLPAVVNGLVGGHGHTLMLVVGVIEIVAGIGVALRPRIFSYVVAAWLWGIIVNLLMIPGYFDVALRDFGLSLAALALGRLSAEFGDR
jgi:hypothetical protein